MANFLEAQLTSGESILVKERPHWIIYGRGALLLVFAVICYFSHDNPNLQLGSRIPHVELNKFAALAFLVWGALVTLNAWLVHITTQYILTTKRLMRISGLLSRNLIGVMLKQVESVTVNQSLIGQIFNYGDVAVIGVGGTDEILPYISNPFQFRNKIVEELPTSS